jgi:ABC-type transport system substrate-binding protein
VLPEAFLTSAVLPWNYRPEESEPRPTYGPYRLVSHDEKETRFSAIDGYFAAGPQQPAEIIERYFANAHGAVEKLRDGQIAILDRVNPYAVPSVHCLLMNPEHPLLARGTFRRALVYGIHRNAILNRQLLRNQPEGRGRVVSGSFPVGYAYDNNIEPRGYNPRLAMSLAKIAAIEAAEPAAAESAEPMSEGKQKQPSEPMAPLILAYPSYEIARIACRSIQRQLELVKIPIELKELPAGVPLTSFDGFDLVYAELGAWEPIVHARELLGPGGIAGRSNSYIELALRQLETAEDSRTAREQLLAIHQMAHDEVCVLPLWQLTDFFAYDRHVRGLGERPVSLYQHVEDWQSTPLLPPDAE